MYLFYTTLHTLGQKKIGHGFGVPNYPNPLLYTSGPVFLKEGLLYTLNKLFVKQVKSFLLLLDLDPFILQCSLHNIEYIKFTSLQDISIKVIQLSQQLASFLSQFSSM